MEVNRNYINENIVNISLMAGKLMADGKISVEDNAELTDHIMTLANSFEESHKGVDYNAPVKEGEASPDYRADIGAFAEKSLIEAYPPKKEARWSFAETALGKFCLEEVPYRLRDNFDIDPDTLDSNLISALAERLFDVCLDNDAMDECIENFLNEHGISMEEHTNEALTEEQALSDVRQYLEQQSDRYFADRRTTKEEVLADTKLLVELAGRHHCVVNMFDGERESSYMNACDYEPGINMDAVYLMSGSVKKEFFRGTPAECEKFCEDNNWSYLDENRFEWDLALKSEVGPIKPSLTQQIQDAAAQTDKGVQQERPSLVQMPGTQDPDWGKKHWGEGR